MKKEVQVILEVRELQLVEIDPRAPVSQSSHYVQGGRNLSARVSTAIYSCCCVQDGPQSGRCIHGLPRALKRVWCSNGSKVARGERCTGRDFVSAVELTAAFGKESFLRRCIDSRFHQGKGQGTLLAPATHKNLQGSDGRKTKRNYAHTYLHCCSNGSAIKLYRGRTKRYLILHLNRRSCVASTFLRSGVIRR